MDSAPPCKTRVEPSLGHLDARQLLHLLEQAQRLHHARSRR